MKTTLTSENAATDIKIINRNDADLIIQNINKELRTWKVKNFLYHSLVGVLGTVAILGSVIVSVYLDTRSEILTAERLKIIAIASTVSLSILSAFNVISKTNNYIAACDLMQVALFKYNAKLIGLSTLIEAYDKANKIIGGIDFNFDKNFNGTAPGKTMMSVDTEDEEQVRASATLNQPEKDILKDEAPASGAKAKGYATEADTQLQTRPPFNAAAGQATPKPTGTTNPAPVKSEAIIQTDDVSVLVKEK